MAESGLRRAEGDSQGEEMSNVSYDFLSRGIRLERSEVMGSGSFSAVSSSWCRYRGRKEHPFKTGLRSTMH